MNKTIKWIATLAVIAMVVFAGFKFFYKNVPKQSAALTNDTPLLAMFDHNNTATANDFKNSNHILIRLTTGSKSIAGEIIKVWKPGPVILTVETWPGIGEKFQKENILTIVAKGSIDEKIKELSLFISKQNQPTLVRFNPDMEVYVNEFPWQKQSPGMYAGAFNHFAEILKQNAPVAKMVWSPAGYPGTEEYWPGAKWVDMVSVTLKGKSELMTDNYPEAKNQQELILRKLHRMRFFDKPVLIMGSQKLGKTDFQQQAFDAAVNYIQQNKDIEYIDINAADKTISPENLRKDSALITSVFDPSHSLVDSASLSAEHLFVNIMALKSGVFKKKFDSIMYRNRNAIVTMEPWKDENMKNDPVLIENILKGSYDNLFDKLYDVIGTTDKTIYLRWLHEMEIPITRYPWQSQDPIAYIKAYRYFVNYIRNKKPQHIYFVWGPAGDRGSMEFWPGSDVVDYTSIAIYGLPDKNITDHNQQESFSKIFNRKYNRIRFAHKPLFITEFGVKGPASYKAEWLTAAAATIEENKEITGISYFNDTDNPKAWGNIEAPDWSVSPAAYKAFLKQLKTSAKQ